MEECMRVGKIIRKRRRDLDLSQADLAKKIGVSKNNVCAWERGKYSPSGESLLKIMELLSLKLEDFKKECHD
jgi:DNA-binding XRE family transcriptional regulator